MSQTNQEKSIIGSGITIQGNITGAGTLEIHGRIEGDVKIAESIHLAESGQVEGRLDSKVITVAGYIDGEVNAAHSLEVAAKGIILGKVVTPKLQMAPGAGLRASVEMPIEQSRIQKDKLLPDPASHLVSTSLQVF